MAKINFIKKNIIPNWEIAKEAIIVGLVAAIVYFILNFFGIVLEVSTGVEVFIIVLVAVYIKHLFEVRI